MSLDIYSRLRRMLLGEEGGEAQVVAPPIGTQPAAVNEQYVRLMQALRSSGLVEDMKRIVHALIIPRIGDFINAVMESPSMYEMFRAAFILRHGIAPEDACMRAGVDPGTCGQILRTAYQEVLRELRNEVRIKA